jgi:signal transduction histidine kinase
MSHEFRTPLSAIVGLTHVLGRTELPPDARARGSNALGERWTD